MRHAGARAFVRTDANVVLKAKILLELKYTVFDENSSRIISVLSPTFTLVLFKLTYGTSVAFKSFVRNMAPTRHTGAVNVGASKDYSCCGYRHGRGGDGRANAGRGG
jgi:hypothetical protein